MSNASPDADGWWHSQALDVSFRPGHPYVDVRDRDGVVIAPSGSCGDMRGREEARVQATLEEQLAEAARARAELEEMIRRLSGQRDSSDPDTAT